MKDARAAKPSRKQAKKKLLRDLEAAQLAHQKAERKTGKLRAQLEQAEARLAQVAQQLIAVQGSLDEKAAKQPAAGSAKSAPPVKIAVTKPAPTKPTANAAPPSKAKAVTPSTLAKAAAKGSPAVMGNGAAKSAVKSAVKAPAKTIPANAVPPASS